MRYKKPQLVTHSKITCRKSAARERSIRYIKAISNNSVFTERLTFKHFLEKLQKVQNSAARFVLKARKRDHVSPLLRNLHWLPFLARIKYKLSTFWHSFSFLFSVYLSGLLRAYNSSRQPRSSFWLRTICITKVKTKHLDIALFPILLLLFGILCFMIRVNVWWVYLAPQNIPRTISVLTLGNKVILYIVLYCSHVQSITAFKNRCEDP